MFCTQSSTPTVALAGKGEICDGSCLKGVEVADLTLGKPSLVPLSTSATVAQALKALKFNKDIEILGVSVEIGSERVIEDSVLSENGCRRRDRYPCGAMVTTMDIIAFLATDGSLSSPELALRSPLSALLPSLSQAVEHIHPHTRLCRGLNIMLHGVQHLVVPVTNHRRQEEPIKIRDPLSETNLSSHDYCWITQEDVVRYFISSLGAFYPLPMMSLEDLGMINTDVMMVDANSPAISAMPLIQRASKEMTAVAVVTPSREKGRPRLAGDISIHTMRRCNQSAAAALATLTAEEFLQYVHDAGGPPQHLVEKVITRLKEKRSGKTADSVKTLSSSPTTPLKMYDLLPCKLPSTLSGISMDEESDISDYSSDEESLRGVINLPSRSIVSLKPDISQVRGRTFKTCRPWSSLVAVMAQALAHRVNHVWVTDVDGGLVGVVTYTDMIDVLLSHLHSSD